MYGLDILASDIEDAKGNQTRFFVLRKTANHSSHTVSTAGQIPATGKMVDGNDATRFKTLIAFTVPHTSPGALASALGVFATHGINLTSINTRPSGRGRWRYIFFVEFAGRTGEDNVDAALGELEKLLGAKDQGSTEDGKDDASGWYRLLGSWKNEMIDD